MCKKSTYFRRFKVSWHNFSTSSRDKIEYFTTPTTERTDMPPRLPKFWQKKLVIPAKNCLYCYVWVELGAVKFERSVTSTTCKNEIKIMQRIIVVKVLYGRRSSREHIQIYQKFHNVGDFFLLNLEDFLCSCLWYKIQN